MPREKSNRQSTIVHHVPPSAEDIIAALLRAMPEPPPDRSTRKIGPRPKRQSAVVEEQRRSG